MTVLVVPLVGTGEAVVLDIPGGQNRWQIQYRDGRPMSRLPSQGHFYGVLGRSKLSLPPIAKGVLYQVFLAESSDLDQ